MLKNLFKEILIWGNFGILKFHDFFGFVIFCVGFLCTNLTDQVSSEIEHECFLASLFIQELILNDS